MISADRPDFLGYKLVLGSHVVAGFVGMYGGLVPVFTLKGGHDHRKWGRLFTYAMSVAALTAFPLAWWHRDAFQGAIGLYSGYLALFGFRVLRRHRSAENVSVRGVNSTFFDWGLAMGSLSAFLVFVALAGSSAWAGSPATQATGRAGLVFGVLGVIVAARDVQGLMIGDNSRSRRILDHLIASSLALLSAVSAFLNTQFHRLTKLEWPVDQKMLLPLVVGLPLLGYWAFVWRRKLKGSDSVTVQEAHPVASELKRLRAFGLAEGLSLLLLLFVAVPLKHIGGEDSLVRTLGPFHGAMFVLYVISLFMALPALKWRWSRVLVALGAAVLPFGTLILDARLRREKVF